MHTLPIQVRLAIAGLREEGREYEEIATVNRVLRRQRETGNVERSARGGGLESAIHGRMAELLCRIVSETNDATYDELTSALTKRGKIATSRSSAPRRSTAKDTRSSALSSPR